MESRRRLQIITVFFLVCMCAIVAEIVNFSFLGYPQGLGSQRVLPCFTLMLGFSWQIIFQGPDGLEIMERLRQRSGYSECTIDQLYLRFSINRTVRIIVVLALWASLEFIPALHSRHVWLLSGAAVISIMVAALRITVIRIRVLGGQFGTTQYEAKELLNFLNDLKAVSGKTFDPPGRMQPLFERTEEILLPNSAEVAL